MDWREKWEEVDKDGAEVLEVFSYEGRAMAYIYMGSNEWHMSIVWANLIPKKKPPTYRPYKRGEVKCGQVFKNRLNHDEFMVVRIWETAVTLGSYSGCLSYDGLLKDYTHLDGTPAGVAE